MTDNIRIAPLSLEDQEETATRDHDEEETELVYNEEFYDDDLDERILAIVRACHKREIRPARLAAELGSSMSIDDACAQLCGLLKAVGEGSSFYFDDEVMVFCFPPDFERKARRFRKRQTVKACLYRSLVVAVKFIRIVTAFGLILSLLIVSIAAMIGLIAAIIAMSRSGHAGGGHHRAELVRRLRSMFYTMRQLLWCYAMFGGNFVGQDPFLQEIAYDLALVTSVCCGNPGSLFFWLRASQLRNRSRRRRRYLPRGWAPMDRDNNSDTALDMEGVALVQRGTWGRDQDDSPNDGNIEQEDSYRGLLSVSVEFLFGPTPFAPGPSESEKWRLRAAVIVKESSDNPGDGVSLKELSPYVDSPPASLSDEHQSRIVSEGLAIVSHFNGRPIAIVDQVEADPSKARFVFPELLAEGSTVVKYEEPADQDDGSFEYLCYSGPDSTYLSSSSMTSGRSSVLPSSLQERRFVLTRLAKTQFQQCVVLGVLNFIGVVWLRQSLQAGGVLDVTNMAGGYASTFLLHGLMPVLYFYSILFFVLPVGRFVLVLILNAVRGRRNRRRADFAHALKTS